MFCRILRIQFKRAIVSPVFLISSVLFGLGMIFNSAEVVKGSYPSVIATFDLSSSGMGDVCLSILPVLPFALSLADERNERSLKFNYVRSSVWNYITAKFIAVIGSGFLVVVLGYCLFFAVMGVRFPINTNGSLSSTAASALVDQGRYFTYLAVMTFNYALSGALFAGLALLYSSFLKGKYALVLLPYLTYDILNHVNAFAMRLLDSQYSLLNPYSWMIGTVSSNSVIGMVGIKLTCIACVLSVAFFVSEYMAERGELCD